MSDPIAFLLFLCGGQAIVIAVLAVKGGQVQQALRRQRVQLEEADAWCEEWRRQAAINATAARQLANLRDLYAYHVTGIMLAANSRQLLPWLVTAKQRKGDQP